MKSRGGGPFWLSVGLFCVWVRRRRSRRRQLAMEAMQRAGDDPGALAMAKKLCRMWAVTVDSETTGKRAG